MTSRFTVSSLIPCSAELLFGESLSVDAHVHSMSKHRECAVAGVISGRMGKGDIVTWRARHFGIWFTMTSEICELREHDRFVDRQLSGPFRDFRHEHLFRQVGSSTEMIDVVTLTSPVGGRFAERAVLVPYVRALILERNAFLAAAVR
jgi:hypothetical protein